VGRGVPPTGQPIGPFSEKIFEFGSPNCDFFVFWVLFVFTNRLLVLHAKTVLVSVSTCMRDFFSAQQKSVRLRENQEFTGAVNFGVCLRLFTSNAAADLDYLHISCYRNWLRQFGQ
jgi:hypothetical protein